MTHERFTAPIIFPDGWRLIITEVAYTQGREALQRGIVVDLSGILVPPVVYDDVDGEAELPALPLLTPEEIDIVAYGAPSPRKLQGGCVMVAPPRERDE